MGLFNAIASSGGNKVDHHIKNDRLAIRYMRLLFQQSSLLLQ